MNNTKHSVAVTLFACMANGNAHYTKAGVRKIQELLKSFQKITVERRWIFYCLADMESRGYIRRKTRYHRKSDGTLAQISSMISFTLTGIKYLVQKRVAGATEMLKRMLKFLAGDDNRWPAEKDPGGEFGPEEIRKNKARFTKLLESLA